MFVTGCRIRVPRTSSACPCSLLPTHPTTPTSQRRPTRTRIHFQLHSVHPGVPRSTRPRPVGRMLHQPPANRVGVDVLDASPGHVFVKDIPVVTAAFQPESVFNLPGTNDFKVSKPVRSSLPQVPDCGSRDRLLHGLQDCTYRIRVLRRPQQHVHVLWHDDICPKLQPISCSSSIEGFDKPLSSSVLA